MTWFRSTRLAPIFTAAGLAVGIIGLVVWQLWLPMYPAMRTSERRDEAIPTVVEEPNNQLQRIKLQPSLGEAGSIGSLGRSKTVSMAQQSAHKMGFANLLQRAESGDQRAANKLFQEARTCHWLRSLPDLARSALKLRPAPGAAASVLQMRQNDLRRLSAGLNVETPQFCKKVTGEQLDGYLYSATLLAAKAGNPTAQGCYVTEQFGIPPNSERGEARLIEYRQNAIGFIRDGIQHGNWYMVQLLEEVYSPPHLFQLFPWLQSLAQPNGEKAYAYMYLLLTHAEVSEGEMARHYGALSTARSKYELSPDEVNRAEDTADGIYAKYFFDKPQNPGSLNPCPAPQIW